MTESNLVERIAEFIGRFVFIKDKSIYRLLALWVIQTHLYKNFEYTGYIYIHSPEPGSGKSRLLEVLNLLVANSSGVLHDPTAAVLFRATGGTQLFDEVDSWTDGRHYLRGVLNGGFQRGSTVKRNERQKDGKWKPVDFDVYAPRAMAGIGLGILHGTTTDRTFIIEMVRQTLHERRAKFRIGKVRPEADQLKGEIEAWVNQKCECCIALYDNADTTLAFLAHLHDRTIDIVEPLAAILGVIYAGTPELEERRVDLLEVVSLTRKD